MKRPAFQFYPADWRKDVELRSCSIAARGLWIDMMCLAHECDPYGHLTVNGKPMTPAKIAGQVGVSEAMAKKLIAELLENGVVRITDDGVLYSARMVRDEALRNARAEGGKSGATHGAKGGEHGRKGGRPKKSKGGFETPLETPLEDGPKPPPSSSSSSSEDSVTDVTDGQAVEPDPPQPVIGELQPPAAPPPPPTDQTPPTARERVYANGVPLLLSASVPERNARSMLALLCKTYGDDAVANAIDGALMNPPIDPIPWLHRVLKDAGPSNQRARPQDGKFQGAAAAIFDGARHV